VNLMRARPAPLLIFPLLALGACQGDDFSRPGTWRAARANDANLAVMLANPQDLRQGRAAPDSRGQAASVAVGRLESGRRFPLPASTLSRIAPVSPEPVAAQPVAGGGANAR
jgi:hypothetical protein